MARKIKIMGIINVTDDSYFADSRCPDSGSVLRRAEKMLREGADILDIGGCSTRPGAECPDMETEWERLEKPLVALRKEFPDTPVSVDTFHAGIISRAYDSIGKIIANDISAGAADPEMLPVVGKLGLRYIAMHMKGNPQTMQTLCDYKDVTGEVKEYFHRLAPVLEKIGIHDYIIDPGFGFAKTIDQNYELLHNLGQLKALGHEILVGVSRKSMIYKLFNITPQEALPATQALHLEALIQGADILRVHDVAQAVQCAAIYGKLYNGR